MTGGDALPQADTNIAPRYPNDRLRAAPPPPAARRGAGAVPRRRDFRGSPPTRSTARSARSRGSHTQPRRRLNEDRAYPSVVSWPQQGQAAFLLGLGAPAASRGEQAVAIASLAKVMTAYLTLERHPLSGARDGFTTTVTPAQAQAEARDAAEDQSDVAVQAGEQLTERQLLEAR